jgi:hypothetical protein
MKLLFDKHENDIEDLKQKDTEQERSKVNVDTFDKETHELKEMIKSMNGGQTVQFINGPTDKGEAVSKEDIDRWNAAANMTQKQDKMLGQITHTLETYNYVKTSVDNLNEKILQCASKDDLNDLAKQVYKLQAEMQQAQKEI